MDIKYGKFIWSAEKEAINKAKHGIDFITASAAFTDAARKIFTDTKHNNIEMRYFCIGSVRGRIITVRFTYRRGFIRIIGAGCWRKGKGYYEKKEN